MTGIPRHAFDGAISTVTAKQSLTGLSQTERTCTLCPVVKVTVHERGGGARREWRPSKDSPYQGTSEIVCTGVIGMANKS